MESPGLCLGSAWSQSQAFSPEQKIKTRELSSGTTWKKNWAVCVSLAQSKALFIQALGDPLVRDQLTIRSS